MKETILLFLLLALPVGFTQASCAKDSFANACANCAFDESGKLDESCWKDYEGAGTQCLATSYPSLSLKYTFGTCPQMDECVSRLGLCRGLYTTASDKKDCENEIILSCFETADKCVEAANKVCVLGMSEEEAGFNDPSAGGTKTPEPEPVVEPNKTGQEGSPPEPPPLTEKEDGAGGSLCSSPAFIIAMLGGSLLSMIRNRS